MLLFFVSARKRTHMHDFIGSVIKRKMDFVQPKQGLMEVGIKHTPADRL